MLVGSSACRNMSDPDVRQGLLLFPQQAHYAAVFSGDLIKDDDFSLCPGASGRVVRVAGHSIDSQIDNPILPPLLEI